MPPFATGSSITELTVASSKVILARVDYHDLPLTNLTALSFSTYIDPGASNTTKGGTADLPYVAPYRA